VIIIITFKLNFTNVLLQVVLFINLFVHLLIHAEFTYPHEVLYKKKIIYSYLNKELK